MAFPAREQMELSERKKLKEKYGGQQQNLITGIDSLLEKLDSVRIDSKQDIEDWRAAYELHRSRSSPSSKLISSMETLRKKLECVEDCAQILEYFGIG